MGRVDQTVGPYAYPPEAHRRRHGPAGYADYREYWPWLKDEFCFRCVYCLKRMVWEPTDIWVVDHVVSRESAPELECEYDNLVLACQFCNGRKGPNRAPDPCQVAFGDCLRVEADGIATPLNDAGRRLEKVLRLNHERYVQERRKWLRILSILARHDRAEFERLMGFPSDLPDLTRRKPPFNRRPEGIAGSWFERKRRGELPNVY
jgi:hypothetical protein